MKILFIEGSDYTGKTSLIKNLNRSLLAEGYSVLVLKEPSDRYRNMLLSSDSIKGFARRKLFEVDHLELMEQIYNSKDKYDYVIVDRCAPVSDFIYSHADTLVDGKENLIYRVLEDYKIVDKKMYNNFFKENSFLIILKINEREFKKRVLSREVNQNDLMDKADFGFKKLIYSLYNSFIELSRNIGLKPISVLFNDIFIVEDRDFLKKIKEYLEGKDCE